MSILRFSSFVAISLLLIASPVSSSHAAVKCATANAEPALNGPCGQLGATRMLGDYSAIVACVVKDPTQTGEERDCAWSSMSSGGAVLPGTMCGTARIVSTSVTSSSGGGDVGSNGGGGSDHTTTTCSVTQEVPCNGAAIIVPASVAWYQKASFESSHPNYTYACVSSSGLPMSHPNYYYYLKNCPTGYKIASFKTEATSTTGSTTTLSCIKE